MIATLTMAQRLLTHVKANKGDLLREEIKNLTGEDLLEAMSGGMQTTRQFASEVPELKADKGNPQEPPRKQ